MCIDRRFSTHRAQHVDLPRRIVEVIVAPDYVRDPHVVIVHHHAEVVGWIAIGPLNDQIIKFAVLEYDGTVHDIVDQDRAIERIREPNNRRDAGSSRGATTAATVIPRFELARELRRTHRLELFFAAIAMIGASVGEPLRND